MQNCLRIGIMCNNLNFAAWEAETIRHLNNTKNVSIELLIGNADTIDPARNNYTNNIVPRAHLLNRIFRRIISLFKRIFQFISTPLWSFYTHFINYKYPADCDRRISLNQELINVDMIVCRTERKGKYSQYFSKSDIDRIKTYNLDMILRFGFNIIRGEILHTPTYGVWSFHHGDYKKYRGGPPGFWEIYNQDPWSGAILQKLTDRLDDGIVLYKSQIKTDFYSYARNKNNLFWSTTTWPSLICRYILSGNNEDIFHNSDNSTAPIYTAPTNRQTIKYFFITAKYKVKDLLKRKPRNKQELWALGIINYPINQVLNSLSHPEIKWIDPPDGRFYADPFIINKNNQSFIFFEDFSYAENKGRISFISTEDFIEFSGPVTAIETDYHLSYPFMLEDKGIHYCIPEQYKSNEVILYKCESFPDKWRKAGILIEDFPGIDPTIIYYQDKWWMFIANQRDNDSSKLYLFYAEQLTGTWKPHKNNPVKIFPKMTRPAGAIFEHNGRLIRPAQNCTVTYGGSIIFYEIVKLSTEDFKEIFIGELLSNLNSKYPDGLHHIIQNNNITIIDGKRLI